MKSINKTYLLCLLLLAFPAGSRAQKYFNEKLTICLQNYCGRDSIYFDELEQSHKLLSKYYDMTILQFDLSIPGVCVDAQAYFRTIKADTIPAQAIGFLKDGNRYLLIDNIVAKNKWGQTLHLNSRAYFVMRKPPSL